MHHIYEFYMALNQYLSTQYELEFNDLKRSLSNPVQIYDFTETEKKHSKFAPRNGF